MIKKILMTAVILCFTLLNTTLAAPAKKPTLMVVPSTIWCLSNGYYTTVDNQGVKQKVPDYKRALEENRDINVIITQMGKMMAERGFPLQDLQAKMNSLVSDEMEIGLITSSSGSVVSESAIEKFNRTAKADIFINVDFNITKNGPRSRTAFNVRALDAYTDKQISGVQGGSDNSTASMDIQLTKAVLNYMDSFTAQIQSHFNDLFANGREISVQLLKFDNCPIDFETEFSYNDQDAELADILGVWFEEHCVEGRYSMDSRSANRLSFSQVRMPLFGKSLSGKEVAIDATGFTRTLASMLKKAPYSVPVKVYPKGLGEIWLIIGDK